MMVAIETPDDYNKTFKEMVAYMVDHGGEDEPVCLEGYVDVCIDELFGQLEILDVLNKHESLRAEAHAIVRDQLIELVQYMNEGILCVCE